MAARFAPGLGNASRGLVGRRGLVGLAAALGLCAVARAGDGGAAMDGEILMQLRDRANLSPLLVRHQLTLLARFGSRPIYRLKAIGAAKVKDKIEALKSEPDVRSAEPNPRHHGPAARKNVAWAIGDPQGLSGQWALEAVRLPEARRLSTGAGVRVAVLDTGIDARHPMLAGRLLRGRDFVDGDDDPSEAGSDTDRSFGHGTHVAGIIATVAPGARIMPLRILEPDGGGNLWVLAEAMLHAVDPDGNPDTDDGAHVINLSVGTLTKTEIFKSVVKLVTCRKSGGSGSDDPEDADDGSDDYVLTLDDKARCKGFGGAIVVAAAGNRGDDKVREYPAGENSKALLSVAASTPNGRLADFSNRGWVEIAAPGEAITSAVPGGGVGTWSGTSMAAPFVSGAAVLLRATDRRLTAEDVAKRVRDRGQKMCNTGTRQLDVAAMLGDEAPKFKRDCGDRP